MVDLVGESPAHPPKNLSVLKNYHEFLYKLLRFSCFRMFSEQISNDVLEEDFRYLMHLVCILLDFNVAEK